MEYGLKLYCRFLKLYCKNLKKYNLLNSGDQTFKQVYQETKKMWASFYLAFLVWYGFRPI